MRLGLFGGSFDPIHCGHIRPVQRARLELELDRVLYLPTADPPHKPGQQFAPAHARYAMVELALLEEEGLFASDYELTPGKPAFTIDTLEYFAAGDVELHLLIGSDSLAELTTWKRWQDIVTLARLVVLARPDFEPDRVVAELPADLASQLRDEDRVRVIPNEPVAASSTGIRERLAQGRELPEGWVPELVVKYLLKYSIYR